MDDYRVAVGWRTHPKRRKLRRRLGADAVLALMDLWEWCATSRTDGDLSGMADEDIALAAELPASVDHNEWVSVLAEIGLLDGAAGAYRVHDWAEHNPWVAGAKARSTAAREAAKARWDSTKCAPHDSALRSASIRNAPFLSDPFPSPSPSRKRKTAPQVAPAPAVPPSDFVAYVRHTWPDVSDVPEARWLEAYPAVDLLAEARKAAAWEASQPPAKRKRDHRAFLGRWFARAQETAAREKTGPVGRQLRSVQTVPAAPHSAFKDEETGF